MQLPHTSIRMATLMICLTGCGTPPSDEPAPPAVTAVEAPAVAEAERAAEADGQSGHDHVAPHGGALAELGNHYAHLEVVVDPERGQITLYVLDGEAERAFGITQPNVVAEVITDGEPFVVQLQAVARVLTGERVGDTSEFRGMAPELAGATNASIRVETITVRGQTFDNVRLRWVGEAGPVGSSSAFSPQSTVYGPRSTVLQFTVCRLRSSDREPDDDFCQRDGIGVPANHRG